MPRQQGCDYKAQDHWVSHVSIQAHRNELPGGIPGHDGAVTDQNEHPDGRHRQYQATGTDHEPEHQETGYRRNQRLSNGTAFDTTIKEGSTIQTTMGAMKELKCLAVFFMLRSGVILSGVG